MSINNSKTLAERAQDEITRRANNAAAKAKANGRKFKKTRTSDSEMLNLGGAALAFLAGVEVSKPVKVATVQVTTPKVDKRIIVMTDEQRQLRNELYVSTGGGAAYHEACATHGIPTRKTKV